MNKYPEDRLCGTIKSETPELEKIIDQLNSELASLIIYRQRLFGTLHKFRSPGPVDCGSEKGPEPRTVIDRFGSIVEAFRYENKSLQELANNFDKII